MPALLAAAFSLVCVLNALSAKLPRAPFPGPDSMRLTHEDATQNCALLALGMRRLAADLAFIRLLMYYGTPEGEAPHSGSPAEPERHEHDRSYGGGEYAEMLPRALRVLELDPYLSYAPLWSSGALAFNLNRPEEALQVLRAAVRWQPRQWKYRAYMAAIGFHKDGNPKEVVAELTPLLSDPDCPALIKNILAYLNRRLGRGEEAVRIYLDLLASRDSSYHPVARKALRELGARPPWE